MSQDDSILRDEVGTAIKLMKQYEAAGVDIIPYELIIQCAESIVYEQYNIYIYIYIYICIYIYIYIYCYIYIFIYILLYRSYIWETGNWPSFWTKYLIITLPKKYNL